MFDRHERGDRAILVSLNIAQVVADHEEFRLLVDSTGTECLLLIEGSKSSPEPKYFVGSGKAQEIADMVSAHEADVIIFDHALSPSQERNLEELCKCRVLDRTTLILDIFAQRARSHEGKLQVELAQLRHMSTRLIRGWTHLERQKGGIGMRGPGETQLETDRRLLNDRIKLLRKRLAKVNSQREQGRQSRQKANTPTVALVGYTNAGKSTLFNRLTDADAYAADQLFATLDPTLRRLDLPGSGSVILADTVGFIKHLPHDLVAAFKATLQETREADVLLHVVDSSSKDVDQHIYHVNEVLEQIGASSIPQVLVYNKIDLTDEAPHFFASGEETIGNSWVSAKTGAGLTELKTLLNNHLSDGLIEGRLLLPVAEGKIRAELYEEQVITGEQITAEGDWELQIRLTPSYLKTLQKQYSHFTDWFDNATIAPSSINAEDT